MYSRNILMAEKRIICFEIFVTNDFISIFWSAALKVKSALSFLNTWICPFIYECGSDQFETIYNSQNVNLDV